MEQTVTTNPPGRPRAFCTDKALDAAMKVFADKGFESASLSDLTKAMGISRPSMYAAFGNKEELYRLALERYSRDTTEHVAQCLAGLPARQGVHKLLSDAVKNFTDPKNAGCCFVTQAPLNDAAASLAAQRENEIRRGAVARQLQQRFDQAKKSGEMPESVATEDMARYFSVVLQGIALQAQHGGTRQELLRVVDFSMAGWPGG